LGQPVPFLGNVSEMKSRYSWDPNIRHGKNVSGHQIKWSFFRPDLNIQILLRKKGARLNLKIELLSLHIDPEN
jgi:hypothetical protein